MRQNEGRRLRLTVSAVVLSLAVLLVSGSAGAVVREGGIEGRPGFSFRNLIYKWDHLFVDIVNGTPRNVTFGGTMLFLDRYGRTVARAELLPAKVKRQAFRRYKGQFVQGGGEEAAKADRLMWLFDLRNE